MYGKKEKRKQRTENRLRALGLFLGTALVGLAAVQRLFAWGGLPHQYITDAALTALPASDEISLRLGGEARHLRDTVEMGDWMNSLITVQENWHVTTEDFPQTSSEYFGNDYLLFPGAPHFFQHMMPQVHETYGPYFLRNLQALRTEDQANAVRWVGSLLHFVTDSGSPPHTIGLSGPNHTKMENWLDASHIDLRGYHPQLLGRTDAEAVEGLRKRMDGLIARNAVIARHMVPYAQADDRPHVEPLALDCAEETARVAADVLHTLLVLSAEQADGQSGASLTARVTAPALAEHPLLPAKIVLLGTDFSTLSSLNYSLPDQYAGTLLLRNLPPGTYRVAIERPGSQTLFPSAIVLRANERASFEWHLRAASPAGNVVPNADFSLRWVTPSAPDHWRHDDGCHCWRSDNIPVAHGNMYHVYVTAKGSAAQTVTLEWMAQHWKRTDDAPVPVAAAQGSANAEQITAPATAVYARFVIAGDAPPENVLDGVALLPVSQAGFVQHK
ncbi:hypothetical protein [Paracidobacterium acidisoli]|uniref:Uncharacterized protein n=1 Tax=Paracidobacterium acidisoli TaxID=2303751 RepID=A0A372IQK2_9BACT|nr:hypothetical protein [Paracidobacterium acidisoli]MBT9331554.1 hypothetical protein [Paracidobacterium acidisoli]